MKEYTKNTPPTDKFLDKLNQIDKEVTSSLEEIYEIKADDYHVYKDRNAFGNAEREKIKIKALCKNGGHPGRKREQCF